jgi:DNA polymerase/3'-5' exonuclease PolX
MKATLTPNDSSPAVNPSPNREVAARLDEVVQIFAEQGVNRFRVQAYRNAANAIRRLPYSIAEIFAENGMEGLEEIEGVGPSIARAIRDILLHGRLAMLDRLRGESEPVSVLASVPGVGQTLARRLHEELGIETLEEFEVAAHDGRLETSPALGRSVSPAFAIHSRNASGASADKQRRRGARASRPLPKCSMSIANTVRKPPRVC